MSKSILELLGNLNVQGVKQPSPEGEIYNPDVPNSPDTIAGNARNREVVKDQYYSDMKLESIPRNGSGFYFGKTNGRQRYFDPRDDAFMLDGSIDPNNIRRKTDPANSLPATFANGSLYDKYQLGKDNYQATNNVSLIQRSVMSFENYKNRFVPQMENSEQVQNKNIL